MKVTIISDDSRLSQQLVQTVNFLNYPLGELIEKPREAYRHLEPKEPRVVLLVEPQDTASLEHTLQQLRKVNESAAIVYLCKSYDFAKLRELYRSGVTDVLQVPDELEQLGAVVEKAARQTRQQRQRPERLTSAVSGTGRIIALYSGKGGSGTTVVSAHLAQALALYTGGRTLLIDLHLQFGGIHQLLDLKYERNLGDLKTVLRELTLGQLSNVLYKLQPSGLDVLLSPSHPQEAEQFKSEDIELLFTACRQHFDYIVVDMPKELNEASISAISQSDQLLYVINLDRPSIVRMQGVIQILERYHLIREQHVSLVVNKYSKKTDVMLGDLEKMTTLPILGTIADDPKGELQTAVNLGQLLIQEKKEKGLKGLPKDIVQLMNAVIPVAGGEKHVHLPAAQQPIG